MPSSWETSIRGPAGLATAIRKWGSDGDFSQCGIVAKNRARLSLDRSSALVLSEPGICVAPTLIGYVLL